MVSHTSVSTRRRVYGGTVNNDSKSEIDMYRTEPALERGLWIDLGNGNRFRRPTDYSRTELVLERNSPALSKGKRNINNYVSERVTGPGGYGIGNFYSGNWLYRYSSELGVPNLQGPPSFPAMEENESITKSLNEIADYKANIGENLATLGQTVRLLASPLKAYQSLLRAFPKGLNRRDLARLSYRDLVRGKVPKRISDQYLAYVYGFKPLMSDIYGLIELAKDANGRPLLLNGRGRSERYLSAGPKTYNNVSESQNEAWDSCVAKALTRTTVWAKVSDEFHGSRVLNQLSLLNPASLAWELVPYSFVIDWALPIGPVLSAMTAPAGLDFVGGSTSRRLTAYWNYSITHYPPGGYTWSTNEPATGKFRYNGYNRKRLNSWPRPGLWIAPDPLGLTRDGSDRALKALALLISRSPNLR